MPGLALYFWEQRPVRRRRYPYAGCAVAYLATFAGLLVARHDLIF